MEKMEFDMVGITAAIHLGGADETARQQIGHVAEAVDHLRTRAAVVARSLSRSIK